MLNSHLKATNIGSHSLAMKGLNQTEVEKRRRIRTNAEMADVNRMGEEIEAAHFATMPVALRTITRKKGPSCVQISHNKNTSSLEEIYSPEWWAYIRTEVRNHWNEKAVA
jgi:hypothetical protein